MTEARDSTGRYVSRVTVDKDWLVREYVERRRSADDIGIQLGCSGGNVLRLLRKHGIPRRKAGESRRGQGRDLTGLTFGKLKVLCRFQPRANKPDRWLTICECGREYLSTGTGLILLGVVQCRECSCPKLGFGDVPQALWSQILKGARKRKWPVEITVEYANSLYHQQNGLCALSGVQIGFATTRRGHTQRRETTASLDRKNPLYGYVAGNVQWIHKDLQPMKHRLTNEPFIEWCTKVGKYNDSSSSAS